MLNGLKKKKSDNNNQSVWLIGAPLLFISELIYYMN